MELTYRPFQANGVAIFLDGRLDATTCKQLRATLQSLIKQGYSTIIIDLERVAFIDSSGLAVLVSALRLIRQKHGEIFLSGLQPQAQTVFRLTMLDRVFPIHPTIDDARARAG